LHIRLENLELSRRILDDLYVLSKDKNANLIILGDLFHTKAIIRSECLNLVLERFSRPDWNILVLVGNHDYETAQCKEHALSSLNLLENVDVIDDYRWFSTRSGKEIAFIPYRPTTESFEEFLKQCNNEKYLFCHQGIRNFLMNNNKVDDIGVEDSILKKFDRVISGHYHKPHQGKNIIYVGSPYQQNFGESGERKRIIELDTVSNNVENIYLDDYPKYIIKRIKINDLLKNDTTKLNISDIDHLRLDLVGAKEEFKKITNTTIRDKINFDGDIRINYIKEDDADQECSIEETLDYINMFENWLKLQQTTLDKNKLFKIGKRYIDASI